MSHTLNEQLSALLDGELPVEQQELLLRRLDSDPELRERFARYSLIGDVLTDHEVQVGALQIADRVREQLDDEEASQLVRQPADRRPGTAVGSGLLGAGLAAAAALIVVLNLGPNGDEAPGPRLTGLAPMSAPVAAGSAAAGIKQPDRLRANVAPERMTRYLVTHAEFANFASRQFVDSHIVMPAYQRVAWQTSGTRR